MSAKVIMVVHSSSTFLVMAKAFNYNHKPQYIEIKTYPIMPCALPLSAFLTFAMSICKKFIFQYFIQHSIQYFSQCKTQQCFHIDKNKQKLPA